MDYQIIFSESIYQLAQMVKNLISSGYEPIGNISYGNLPTEWQTTKEPKQIWAQAMIRKEN